MPADTATVFKALCESRALRADPPPLPREAVDPLQAWADANGLVRLIDVQAIMADAFRA